LTQNEDSSAAGNLFADLLKAPAVQLLARRVEQGGALMFSGVAASARPFFAVLLQKIFPGRPVVVVTENLKIQESFQQDLETWLAGSGTALLFYPAWEILPHEGKLPHADVISERLQTLVALAALASAPTVATMVVTSVSGGLEKPYAEFETRRCAGAVGFDRVFGVPGLRTGSAGFAKRGNGIARRHCGSFSADESMAGAVGVFWR
jgi:hypothetical protein